MIVPLPLRIAAWLVLALVVLATLGPPSVRPVSGHRTLEHFAAFALVGFALLLAYPRAPKAVFALGVVAMPLALEIAQLIAPGRHAYVADWLIDTAGAAAGFGLALLLLRLWTRRRETSR